MTQLTKFAELTLKKERSNLLDEKNKLELEIKTGCTEYRRRTVKNDLHNIHRRLSQIKVELRGSSVDVFEIFHQAALLSLPDSVYAKIRQEADDCSLSGGVLADIKPISIFSDKDLDILSQSKELNMKLKQKDTLIVNTKVEAQKLFIMFNARLTPDEVKEHSDLFDFLRKIINGKT